MPQACEGGCGKKVDVYSVIFDKEGKGVVICKACRRPGIRITGSTFPFVAEFGIGGPGERVRVNSMYHLRQLERQHGVQSVAYNMNEANTGRPQAADFHGPMDTRKPGGFRHGEGRL